MKTQNNKNLLNPVAKLTSIFMLAMLIALAVRLRRWRIRRSRRNPTPTPGAGANSAQVRFGDAPADSVIAFEVSVSALSLTPAGGGTPGFCGGPGRQPH